MESPFRTTPALRATPPYPRRGKFHNLYRSAIDAHTLERAEERGATKEEIIDVITNGTPIQAKHGRLAKAKVYPYGKLRGNKLFEQKRIEVIYIVEQNSTVTVTVYVFYGKWVP